MGHQRRRPILAAFKDKPWSAGQRTKNDAKVYAAFMHMVDRQLGELMALLKELKLDDDTIIFLCGDNGGQPYFMTPDRPHGFFGPNLNPKTGKRFRAGKGLSTRADSRCLTWCDGPKRVKANSVSDHMLYYPDIMPTLAELAQAICAPKLDGLSFPAYTTRTQEQKSHNHLYWEYGNQGQ